MRVHSTGSSTARRPRCCPKYRDALRQVVVCETEPQSCTNANAQRHLNEWALEDDSQDVERLRAERHAHADLPRPPGDGEGRHRIDTGERQHQRHARQADHELEPVRHSAESGSTRRGSGFGSITRRGIGRLRELAETHRKTLRIAANVNGDSKRPISRGSVV